MPTKDEKIQAITLYLSVPEPLRPVPTIRQLALSIGATPDGGWYRLVHSPEVTRQVLGLTSALTLAHLPGIFEALIKKAKKGNVGAADILLKHIREVVEKTPPEPRPVVPLHQQIEEAARAAGDLNRLADSFSTEGSLISN